MGIEFVLPAETGSYLGSLVVQPTLLDEIKQAQMEDEEIERIRVSIGKGKASKFVEDQQRVIRFHSRICVPQEKNLKE